MLTKKDLTVLDILKYDAKLSTREISEKTGIPITTVHNRIKKLEKEGIIKAYKAIVDKKKIGKSISAYILLTVSYKDLDAINLTQESLAKKFLTLPEVEECSIISGASDIILKVATKDVDELNDFVINKLRHIGGVEKTLTSIVLKDVELKGM